MSNKTELAKKIAAAIFSVSSERADRIALKVGKSASKERELCGFQEGPLAAFIERTLPDELASEPLPMLLRCPSCSSRHIDEGEFETKPHHTHACQTCGEVWRPAVVATVGVKFLPGVVQERAAHLSWRM